MCVMWMDFNTVETKETVGRVKSNTNSVNRTAYDVQARLERHLTSTSDDKREQDQGGRPRRPQSREIR